MGSVYQGQELLVLVLTVKRNDPVTRSKHEAHRGKESNETGNDNVLPVP